MSYTTIQQLTTANPSSGEIEQGPGYFKPGYTFFYWEDIKQVITQSTDAPMENLRLVNVVFERSDECENHNRHKISVLALRKTDAEISAMQGKFDNQQTNQSKWHDKVALAWPIYYEKANTDTLLDDDNPDKRFLNRRFEGSTNYVPGFELHKNP